MFNWGRLQCFMCVVGILGCYHDYSVIIMSKNIIFCWFSLYFHLYHTPWKQISNFFFWKIKVSLKYDRSGKFQVVYITSYFTIAFWSWVVISNSLRNPCNLQFQILGTLRWSALGGPPSGVRPFTFVFLKRLCLRYISVPTEISLALCDIFPVRA